MEFWQLKYYLKFRYTREQRKAMAGKIQMTEDLFWGCMDICWKRLDRQKLRWLLDSFPQYMKKFSDDYERRLQEDAAFREQEEAEAERLKALCLAEFGEDWVKENWRD